MVLRLGKMQNLDKVLSNFLSFFLRLLTHFEPFRNRQNLFGGFCKPPLFFQSTCTCTCTCTSTEVLVPVLVLVLAQGYLYLTSLYIAFASVTCMGKIPYAINSVFLISDIEKE